MLVCHRNNVKKCKEKEVENKITLRSLLEKSILKPFLISLSCSSTCLASTSWFSTAMQSSNTQAPPCQRRLLPSLSALSSWCHHLSPSEQSQSTTELYLHFFRDTSSNSLDLDSHVNWSWSPQWWGCASHTPCWGSASTSSRLTWAPSRRRSSPPPMSSLTAGSRPSAS